MTRNESLEAAAKNTDNIIWSRTAKEDGPRYASLSITEGDGLTICLSGYCVTKPIEFFHEAALKTPGPDYSYEIGSGEHIDIKTPEQAEVEGIVSRLDEISNFIQLHHPNATNFIHLSEAAALITKQAEQIAALREALRTLSDAFLKYARHPRYCRSNAPHLKAEYGVDHCDCGLTEALSKTATLAYTDAS